MRISTKRPRHNGHPARSLCLSIGNIHNRLERNVGIPILLHIRNDAYDTQERLFAGDCLPIAGLAYHPNPPSENFFTRKVFIRECLVDDDRCSTFPSFGWIKCASLQDWYSEDFEVLRCDLKPQRGRPILRFSDRLTLQFKRP